MEATLNTNTIKSINKLTVWFIIIVVYAWPTTNIFAVGNKPPAKLPIPEIVAHRGFSDIAPENTLAAINLAWKIGCPCVECDVYLTKDHRIMLMHDKSTKRTTGKDLYMAETGSDQLRNLDAGFWKDPQYAGEKIPFLEEVLEG